MDFNTLTDTELKELRDKLQSQLQSMKGWLVIVQLLNDIKEIDKKLEECKLLEKQ